MWRPQQASFAPHYRTIALDLPGFGRSPRLDTPIADAVVAALDALGVGRTHLVGLSLGGAAATDVVLAHPARVASLTLADALLLGYPATLDTWARCAELARAGDCAAALAHWRTDPVFAVTRRRPAAWAAIETMLAGYDCAHWTGAATLRWASTKARARLHEIAVPTLVIVGEHDTPGFQAMAEVYAGQIPGARRVVLAGAGHVSSLEESGAFDASLAELLGIAG